jgi:hypothetical protein
MPTRGLDQTAQLFAHDHPRLEVECARRLTSVEEDHEEDPHRWKPLLGTAVIDDGSPVGFEGWWLE